MGPTRTLGLLLPMLSTAVPAQTFPWYQSPVNGHLYTLTPYATWQQAEAHAIGLGGHLAAVRSQEEQDWLFGKFGSQQLWIGVRDAGQDGRFIRCNGDLTGFSSWAPGMPSGAAAADRVISNGTRWFNAPGGLLRPGIVELADLAAYTSFGMGCASSAGVPVLSAAPGSLPHLGGTLTAELSNLPTSPQTGNAFVLFGFSKTIFGGIPLPADLTPFGITGCVGYVSADASFLIPPVGGTAQWSLDIPDVSQLLGLTFYNQALVQETGINPFGAVMTNAAEATIGAEVLYPTGFGPSIGFLGGAYIDSNGTHAVLVRRNFPDVFGIDLATGHRTVVSDAAIGTGVALDSSVGVAVAGDRAWVLNDLGATRTLMEIDLLTGQRTILADEGHGTGPWITALPWQLVLEGDRILLSSGDLGGFGNGCIIAVDRTTGDRTIVSDPITGTGPALELPSDMAVDGSRVLVSDSGLQAIIAVDLATGDRTVVSDAVTGAGPAFGLPIGIVVDGSRALVADDSVGIVSVNLATGDRTILSGPAFQVQQTDLCLDGDRLLVTDGDRVVAVDLVTGDRTVMSM